MRWPRHRGKAVSGPQVLWTSGRRIVALPRPLHTKEKCTTLADACVHGVHGVLIPSAAIFFERVYAAHETPINAGAPHAASAHCCFSTRESHRWTRLIAASHRWTRRLTTSTT